MQDSYLSTTTNVSISPTQSSNITALSKRDSSSLAQTGVSAVGDKQTYI